MNERSFTVISNKRIAKNTFEINLSGDTTGMEAPGRFVNIKLEGFYLRRPISVCNVEKERLILIYKVVGGGTEYMSTLKEGTKSNLLTDLGNGFDTQKSGKSPLLIGGGCGVPPLYLLAKTLVSQGKEVTVIMGFNTRDEVFWEENFKALNVRTIITTLDGTYGIMGYAADAMTDCRYTYTFACGPQAMLRAVYNTSVTSGQYSFEERMGCGFGACMGCSCKTLYGTKRICKEGPVLEKEEIIWQN